MSESQMNPNAMNIMANRVWNGLNDFLNVNNGYAIQPTIGTINYGSAGIYKGQYNGGVGLFEQYWSSSSDLYGGNSAVALGSYADNTIDSISGGRGSDILYGGWGNKTDYLGGGYLHDTVYGGNDVIFGGGGDNGIATYYGNDLVVAGWDLTTNPGAGVDFLNTWITLLNNNTFTSSFSDFGGNNLVSTGLGNDTVITGSGDDTIYTGSDEAGQSTFADNDVVYAGDGQDSVHGQYGDDILYGEGGDDILYGDGGNDFLFGGTEKDSLIGGTGNDTILGGVGADTIIGDDGIDLASYETSAGAVEINLSDTVVGGYAQGKFSDAEGDMLHGIENLLGSVYGDVLIGGAGNNILNGNSGNDGIDGSLGDDTLWGGAGNDTLAGNSGVDHLLGGTGDDFYTFRVGSSVDFVYENANEGTDYAYLQDITSIGVFKNGNDLWLAPSNDDIMVLADWYVSNNVEYVYFQATQELFTTQNVAQYAQDITPTAAAMFTANANVENVPSIINTDIQLNPDLIALAGVDTPVLIELA